MDFIFAELRNEILSNDATRQKKALLLALHISATGKDISCLAPVISTNIIANASNAICKRLAFSCIRITRLTAEEWDSVCLGIKNDLQSIDPDVSTSTISFLSALPSWRAYPLVKECVKELSNCLEHGHVPLRQSAVECLGCLFARDDMISQCADSSTSLEHTTIWWKQIAKAMLDPSDVVSRTAFEAAGRLFSEVSTKRLSRLAGDKLVASESSRIVRAQFVQIMCDFIWSNRNLLMARASALSITCVRETIYPLVYAARAVASGQLDEMKSLLGSNKSTQPTFNDRYRKNSVEEDEKFIHAERISGVSDIVSHLVPFLSSLDPALVYEVGSHVLYLASLPGGKPEWASASITAFLTLWERQDYSAGKEAIVKALVSNIQLLDLHMQVALFQRLLQMVRNLRVEADRMHALVCICRTALCVHLFVKESAKRGQKPMQGADLVSLFGDSLSNHPSSNVGHSTLFREELLACLVETCFQLSLPMQSRKDQGRSIHVLGILSSNADNEMVGWHFSALEVLEVARDCVKWDCEGRTYAVDCYLRLLVKLCHLHQTVNGVRSVKEGISSEQIQTDQRLQTLLLQLAEDLKEVSMPRIRIRLLWVLSEHMDLSGPDPLYLDEPTDKLNMLIASIHHILFDIDSSLAHRTNRLQDVQTILVLSLHLGSRSFRAASLVSRELDDFRNSLLSDPVNKHHCRLFLHLIAHAQVHEDQKWVAHAGPTGEYPFTHHKLSSQYYDVAGAQDRKLDDLVQTAVRDLWTNALWESELVQLASRSLRSVPRGIVLSGSSDPVMVTASHLTHFSELRATLNISLLNITEFDITNVNVSIGLIGGLNFMDGAPRGMREISSLPSMEAVNVDFTVSVSRFERCAFCLRLSYHLKNDADSATPFSSSSRRHQHILSIDGVAESEEEEDPLSLTKRKNVRIDYEPLIFRCKPFSIPLTHLLLPRPCSPVEFFRTVSSLPAMAEHYGTYTYESNDAVAALDSEEIGTRRLFHGIKGIEEKKSLHKVCSHLLRSRAGFQVCYMAKTWFGDPFALVIFGTSDFGTDGGLGEDHTTMLCKFVLRSSSKHVLDQIINGPQDWLDDLTDGCMKSVSDAELKDYVTAKQKTTAQQIAFLKQNMKQSTDGIFLPGEEVEETAVPDALVIPEEQQALQVAVIQEWRALRARQSGVESSNPGKRAQPSLIVGDSKRITGDNSLGALI